MTMNENVNVCITPKGDKPILHFSQFDNERVFTVTVLADDGESAAVLTGLDIEFRLRKTDSHVVTIAPESVADNVITFKTTEQLCACCGQNIATVTLMKDDLVISTLDILVDIQRDILSGGLTSESDIRNLTTQIEQIVPEVVGDDYYNKQEVDELIAEHTFDPSNYYDKQEVDELIAEHTFDPSNYYNKSDVDDLLEDKADADDVYTKAETDNLLADKADKSAIASLIVQKDVAKAPIASFNTDLAEDLTKIIVDINPVQSGTGTPSPSNVRPISGFSALNVTRTGKNLFDNSLMVNSKTVVVGDTVTLTATGNFQGSEFAFMPVKQGYKYALNIDTLTNGSAVEIRRYNASGTITNTIVITQSTIININDGTTVKISIVYGNRTAGAGTFVLKGFNIALGEDYQLYEPYNGQTATVNFGQTVYGGKVDVTNGNLEIDFANDRLDTKSWSYNSSRGAFNATFSGKKQTRFNEMICSCYANGGRVYSESEIASKPDKAFYTQNNSDTIFIKDSDYTDPTTWLNALGSNTICYPLTTPIEITTTSENLTAISGQNNVYGDTNGDTTVRFTETIGNELGV